VTEPATIALAAWPREPLANGGVVLTSPRGPAIASLCVRPGIAPVRPLRTIIRELAAAAPALRAARQIAPFERFTTDGGEHAAVVELEARVGSTTLRWVIAVVVLDDELVVIEGTGLGPEVAHWTRQLARVLAVGASWLRARRFVYTPPRGWIGARRALATCWLAPSFPRDPAWLVVCDAVPRGGAIERTLELMWPAPADATTTPIERGPLRGTRADASAVTTVVVADTAFRYRVQLHAGAQHEAVLEAVLASIEPCPPPRRDHPNVEVFAWAI
jgi:hypothetical protein